ncbi:MAG TPA: hypothetical protein VKY56_08440 [Chloroflexota bacterium]|nr:hypothetical protein [Chloroflexota bacterium]
MPLVTSPRLGFLIGGLLLGYALGRLLWRRSGRALSYWSVILALAVVGAASQVVFGVLGLLPIWEQLFFPLLVGGGTGLAVTPARPPRRAAWWKLWRA